MKTEASILQSYLVGVQELTSSSKEMFNCTCYGIRSSSERGPKSTKQEARN